MKFCKYILFIQLLPLAITQCKSTKEAEANSPKALPVSYRTGRDSTNSASLNWKQIFSNTDLVALIDEGLINNPDLLIALQRIEGARSGVRLQRGLLFPNLNANISYLQRKFGYYTMDDAGNRTTEIEPGKIVPTNLPDYFVGLQTSWEIDIWGRLGNKKRAAFARYLSSLEGRNLVVTNLVADIANNYYELLALDNELEIIRQTVTIQENVFELSKVQKQAGYINELAVQQFHAQQLNSKAQEQEVLHRIIERENVINYLLGRYPQTITRDKKQLNQALPFKPGTGVPADLLKNRPDIRQAELELVAAKADLKAAKAAFYPTLSISGAVGFQGYKASLLFTNPLSMAYSLLGSLIAPLVNRAAIKAEFRNANARQLEALVNYQKSILNGYVEVYNEVARINSLEKIVALKEQESGLQQQSIETSSALFKSGKASYIEVLTAQRNALQSKIELLDARKREYNTFINLYKSLGGGWQ